MSLCVITSPTSPAAAFPRARYTLPCQPQVRPGLANQATVRQVRAGVPASTSDTNVAYSVPAGRRITQGEEIHTQAEGGREPGTSRTEA